MAKKLMDLELEMQVQRVIFAFICEKAGKPVPKLRSNPASPEDQPNKKSVKRA
jgi:hypothetical protein